MVTFRGSNEYTPAQKFARKDDDARREESDVEKSAWLILIFSTKEYKYLQVQPIYVGRSKTRTGTAHESLQVNLVSESYSFR